MELNDLLRDYESNRIKINGASYIGAPKDNTIMFVSKKVGKLVLNLENSKECVVFAENGLDVPPEIYASNIFIFTDNPQRDYTIFALKLEDKRIEEYSNFRYATIDGYYIGQNVKMGENCTIEPGVLIDHNVTIGNNVVLKSGCKIRYGTVLGDDCIVCENAVIGDPGFNVTRLENKGSVLMPSFGNVIVGNNVYIGAGSIVSRGSAGDTVIKDNVKIDALVRVGHDVYLGRFSELLGACTVAGYAKIGANTVVASNASVRNRISIGDYCYVGMGSVVQHNIKDNKTLTGNPAITLEQYGEKKAFEAQIKFLLRNN